MEKLLSALKNMPEYCHLLEGLSHQEPAALTGVGQINRSHLLAGLSKDLPQSLVLICQDDLAAKRLQEELKAFLGVTAPVLPSRELTLYDTAVVSRSWEQSRLCQLYALAAGETKLQILTWESLSQRTMPPHVLNRAAFHLTVGKEYEIGRAHV